MKPLVSSAHAGFFSQTDQCAFGGIADDAEFRVLFLQLGVVTDEGAVEQTTQRVQWRSLPAIALLPS